MYSGKRRRLSTVPCFCKVFEKSSRKTTPTGKPVIGRLLVSGIPMSVRKEAAMSPKRNAYDIAQEFSAKILKRMKNWDWKDIDNFIAYLKEERKTEVLCEKKTSRQNVRSKAARPSSSSVKSPADTSPPVTTKAQEGSPTNTTSQ